MVMYHAVGEGDMETSFTKALKLDLQPTMEGAPSVHTPARRSQPSSYLTVLALMYLTAALMPQVSANPLPESSGDFEDLSETNQDLGDFSLEPLAFHVWNLAVELRDRQMCDFFYVCNGSINSLNIHNMQLPQLVAGDRCYMRGFHKKTCLATIFKSLQEYESYIHFVKQDMKDEKRQVDTLLVSMNNLAYLLQMKFHYQHKEAFIPDMPPQNAWNKQVKIHVILRNFVQFMEKAIRAIRFMK
ncbi:interleukin-6-like [Amblyraja radiata]|uniref:interleukin-6-like n=1 Tax=Amblyraja radiata TaxID=386614 RepID=UPI001403D9E3|nr:interleukin-6-like [Amblyraja radiata]